MQLVAHPLPAKQHHAEKCRLEEKGRQHLIAKQWPDHAASLVREDRPVRAELVGHHNARNDAHRKGERENLDPVQVKALEHIALRPQPQPLAHGKKGGQADGESREQDMECNHKCELQPGQD